MNHINKLFKNITGSYNENELTQNHDINTQYTAVNNDFATATSIDNRSIITKTNDKLSFAYLENLCKSNDEDYIAKELQTVQECYDPNEYQNWLLTEITVITELCPYFRRTARGYEEHKRKSDYHLSPMEYAVHKKKFNIAKQLINIVELQQQNSGGFIPFLIKQYIKAMKNHNMQTIIDSRKKAKQKNDYYNITAIVLAAVKVYAITNMNILDLTPLIVAVFNYSNGYILETILDTIFSIKFKNNRINEIKSFHKNVSNNQDLNDSIKNIVCISILRRAISYKHKDLIIMILKKNNELFFENNNYYFTQVVKNINNYTVMKYCLKYIEQNGNLDNFSFYKTGYMVKLTKRKVLPDGRITFMEYINPSMYLLNCCVVNQYNENALSVIVHGVNITYDGNDNEDIIDKSQMALLAAIVHNNINMIKILKGLNAIQCSVDVILQSRFLYDHKGNCLINNIEEIEYILSNPLSLQEIISIRFAFNLLKQLNHQENINLKFIKEYIKEKYLLPPALVNKIQSIEDLFFLS